MKTKIPTAYRSGWCSTGGHNRCRGEYAGTECACDCHRCCPTCGRPLETS